MASGTYGNISAGPDRWTFDLSFANTVVPQLDLESFTDTSHLWRSGLTSITPTGAHGVRFGFDGLFNGTEYILASAAVVPEPASVALFGLGLLGAAVARRKSKK